ncbi:excinuclease ABC subunit UvrA [Succiniclasticum ruminis]|uniref:UvrABC system protein A n=1 Tax=Succiniclasticum ruminis DSM 9236 TaxID=1123323 RepID=A0A1I1YZ62_9FIRM|nr:excinuclease ABC subunit UvrA [Succiniclasticum ruminis]SFE24894.1 excinuclease ABC subunit A [Succiniclasticum ruminis DSM 9236]
MKDNRMAPQHIIVRGAKVHNLKNIDVDIPLGKLVAIAGVSGSGKSSLALGTLYAEGSRRYLEALSTYTRRRITQAGRAEVDEIRHVPAALALHQRPGIPGIRSTFGTASELLNSLRLLFSRLGSHCCPNGHPCPPDMNVALMLPTKCPVCGEEFYGPGAEAMAFNSEGACPSCSGTGVIRTVNEDSLVPDDSLTIDEGAVAPWQTLMWSLMKDIARDLGVRTDVPFRDLTPEEKEIVFHGPAKKHHLLYMNEKTNMAGEMDFTYYNAVYTVENALAKVKDEKGMKRVEKFLHESVCPDCGGTRLSEKVRSTTLAGKNLAEATAMTLADLIPWVQSVPETLPEEMRPMAESIIQSFLDNAKRLLDLGLGYLTLDRASNTLSTGERQRVQLARAVRNETTGVLYVLDEPSIGLHPSNIDGLMNVVDSLIADGNSVVLVDHDVRVLKQADHMIELGPLAGTQGGTVLAQGSINEILAAGASKIAPFLADTGHMKIRSRVKAADVFRLGTIRMETCPIHTVHALNVAIPKGRLTAVTGVSGSGKTTLVLESLIPGLTAHCAGEKLPFPVKTVEAEGIRRANLIDASPIGINIRSTVATYSGILDELRKLFAGTDAAKAGKLKAGDFSYNTGSLRCPVCDGTGQISLDVQFLPDVTITCPECDGKRYSGEAEKILWKPKGAEEAFSLPALMAMTVDDTLELFKDRKRIYEKLKVLHDLGLGYLTLGEDTPALSGGEAQRLKLASEMGRTQEDSVFVFDEPTIGLHPLDVKVLLGVFDRLVEAGATVLVIEHDLDVIANADYVIDMGPGGGEQGGRIVACGTPEQIRQSKESITGRYL